MSVKNRCICTPALVGMLALGGLFSVGCRTASLDGAGRGVAADRAVRAPFVLTLLPATTAAEPDVLRLLARVERPPGAETTLTLETEISVPTGATRDCGSPAGRAGSCSTPSITLAPGQSLAELPVVVRGAAAVSLATPIVVRVSLPKNAAFGVTAERRYPEEPANDEAPAAAGSGRSLGGLPIVAPVPTTPVASSPAAAPAHP